VVDLVLLDERFRSEILYFTAVMCEMIFRIKAVTGLTPDLPFSRLSQNSFHPIPDGGDNAQPGYDYSLTHFFTLNTSSASDTF